MKGNKKLLVIAALFLFVGVGVATYAIYKTSVSGTAQVTAAKWDVKFKNGETEIAKDFTITFNSSDCVNPHVASGKIAPGASCEKTITVDAGLTEVDVVVSATTGAITATKGGNTVSTEGANAFTASLKDESNNVFSSTEIAADDSPRTKTIKLVLTWGSTDDSSANTPDVINSADTALNGATITVPVTLTAKQKLS